MPELTEPLLIADGGILRQATADDLRGRQGIQGPPGTDNNRSIKIAGQDLSGQRLVVPQTDGTVIYADNATMLDDSLPVWLTLGAIMVGEQGLVLHFGEVSEVSWSWVPGSVYMGASGVLTQTPPVSPSASFLMEVGTASGPTNLFFNPRPAIVLA